MSVPFDEIPFGDDRPTDGFAGWLESLAATTNEDELFDVLARQRPPTSKLARQQIRGRLVALLGERFKELGSAAAAARTADAWLQEGGDLELQGQGFVSEEIEPWGSSVVGATVLDEVEALVDEYLYASSEVRDAYSLWLAFSHVFDCFGIAPILDLSSPTKRCGKSTAVVLGRHLCRAPLLSGNITPAALFRAVEAWKPTLLIDEADTFAKMSDELRGILNAGHTRETAFVVRAEGDSNEPRLFSTWAPKLVAAIGRLPDTIEDRAIRIVLTRKPTEISKRDAFDPEVVRRDCSETRRRLTRFALDDLDAIATAEVKRPGGLHDRAWNNWKPLLSVAVAAGGDWPNRAEAAAVALTGNDDDIEQEDVGTLALRHVWEALEPAGRLATADVLDHLVARDDGPWAKWWESSIGRGEVKSPAARLAKLLRPFGIEPEQLWIEGRNVRGYDAEVFRSEMVAAYLQKNASHARHARTGFGSHAAFSDPSDPSECVECLTRAVSSVPSGYGDMWLARDGRWRCLVHDAPALPSEVVATREAAA